MKFWKGIIGTEKEGLCGTMDNDGFVPHSIEIDESKYLNYIKNLPTLEPKPESDINKLINYAKKQKWID